MMPEAMLEPELHLVENELRRLAQLVVPRDEGIADDDLALTQQPVADDRFFVLARRVDRHAGNAQPTCRVAPNRKLGAVDDKLAQSNFQQRQRRPCDDQIDARQIEQWLIGATRMLTNPQAANRELRIPAIPSRADRVDLDGLAKPRGQRSGDFCAMRFDLRKNNE